MRRAGPHLASWPGVVEHDIDTPVCLYRCVDQPLHLVAVGDAHGYGGTLPPLPVSSSTNV
jgi:hypothetical protein